MLEPATFDERPNAIGRLAILSIEAAKRIESVAEISRLSPTRLAEGRVPL